MIVKDMIESNAYPLDDKGRPIIPMRMGGTAVIYATDSPIHDGGGKPCPIVGLATMPDADATLYSDVETWREDGTYTDHESGWDLMPPGYQPAKRSRRRP